MTAKTPEDIGEVLDKWDDIQIEHTEKAVRSVLKEEFGGDFCDEDVKTALNLLEKQAAMKKREDDARAAINPADLSPKDNTKEIVKKIGRLLNAKTEFWATSRKSKIYHYNPDIGIWQDDGEELVVARTTEALDNSKEASFMNHIVNEVAAYIRGKNMHSKQTLAGPPEIMVLENGRINIETGEFYPDFDSEEHHIVKIPVSYDSDAKCPEIDKFLGEVLDTDDDIHAVYELSGYCLFKYAVFDIIVVMVGGGANGKGILQEVLTAFLGEENVVSITLQQLAERPFSSAGLYGKLANLAGEIPSTAIKVTERVKDQTGGNRITAEYKGRDQFDFRPFAVLMFATNNPPQVWDDSDGWWRRFRRFDFPNVFPKGDKNTIPRDKLVAKLTTPEELSGYLNKSVKGWGRFRKQGQLTGDRGIVRERIEWTRKTDPIKYLSKVFFSKDRKGPEILKKGIYELYLRFCDAEDQDARTDTTFHKNFQRICGYVSEHRKRVGGKSGDSGSKQVRVYQGLLIDFEKLKKYDVSFDNIDFRPDSDDQLTLEAFMDSISAETGESSETTSSVPECRKKLESNREVVDSADSADSAPRQPLAPQNASKTQKRPKKTNRAILKPPRNEAPDINKIGLCLQIIWQHAELESINDPLLDKDMERLPKSDRGFLIAQIDKKHVVQEKAGQWVLSETVRMALQEGGS